MATKNQQGQQDAAASSAGETCLKIFFQAICPQDKGPGTRDVGAEGGAELPQTFQHIMAMVSGQVTAPESTSNMNKDEFRSRAAAVIPAEVRMFSGCKDAQTSADVSSSAGFSLPADAGPVR
jgi:hypothetical protein